jgi:hypothetical protein
MGILLVRLPSFDDSENQGKDRFNMPESRMKFALCISSNGGGWIFHQNQLQN